MATSMTGPEHYAEAEKLVRASAGYDPEGAAQALAAAQVHATLALAAATALTGYVDPNSTVTPDELAWDKTAGSRPYQTPVQNSDWVRRPPSWAGPVPLPVAVGDIREGVPYLDRDGAAWRWRGEMCASEADASVMVPVLRDDDAPANHAPADFVIAQFGPLRPAVLDAQSAEPADATRPDDPKDCA